MFFNLETILQVWLYLIPHLKAHNTNSTIIYFVSNIYVACIMIVTITLSQSNLTYMIWKQIVVNLNLNTILFKSIISYTHSFKINNDRSCLWQVPFMFTYNYWVFL